MGYETYNASKILSPVLYTVLLRLSVQKITFFPHRDGRKVSLFFRMIRHRDVNTRL
jgi:hypothetical protein